MVMTLVRPKQMLIEAMSAGGFVVSQPGAAHELDAPKFAASTMDEALAFIKREMAGASNQQTAFQPGQIMSQEQFQRYMADVASGAQNVPLTRA